MNNEKQHQTPPVDLGTIHEVVNETNRIIVYSQLYNMVINSQLPDGRFQAVGLFNPSAIAQSE
jgi:hypothetical protein